MVSIEEVEKRFDTKIKELRKELPSKYSNGSQIATQNCAALTMKSLFEILNIDDLNYVNMAAPLAGITNICGAVNAGLMVAGLITGRMGKKEVTLEKAANEGMKFIKRFKKEFGTIHCRDLTGYDLLTIEGMKNYIKNDIWGKQCYKHVVTAVEIIGRLYSKMIAKLI